MIGYLFLAACGYATGYILGRVRSSLQLCQAHYLQLEADETLRAAAKERRAARMQCDYMESAPRRVAYMGEPSCN